MKCFNHPDSDSVGMCRICGKALCKVCAVSTSFGITCSGDCENKAKQYAGRLQNQVRMQGLLKTFSGYYALALGLLLCFVGFFIGGNGLLRYIILIPAIGLIIWSIYLIKKSRSS